MMMVRLLFVGCFLGFIGWQAVNHHVSAPTGLSSERIGQLISKPFWTFSAFMSRSPHAKEKEIGAQLRGKWTNKQLKDDPLQIYLTQLNHQLTQAQNPKSLEWSIHLIEGMCNAFALPGGVVVMGRNLVKLMKSEAELVAIIAHERGHVDLGHCMTAYQNSFRLVYSKLQEEQADDYAFEFLIKLGYDPEALSKALATLKKAEEHEHTKPVHKDSRIIPSLLESHPSLESRIQKQKQKAKIWKKKNPHALNKTGVIKLKI